TTFGGFIRGSAAATIPLHGLFVHIPKGLGTPLACNTCRACGPTRVSRLKSAPHDMNRQCHVWSHIMKKFSMLGILAGAALLTATPLSLQCSQKNVTLSLDSADARIGRPLTATSVAGVHRRAYRRAYRRAAYGTAVAG